MWAFPKLFPPKSTQVYRMSLYALKFPFKISLYSKSELHEYMICQGLSGRIWVAYTEPCPQLHRQLSVEIILGQNYTKEIVRANAWQYYKSQIYKLDHVGLEDGWPCGT